MIFFVSQARASFALRTINSIEIERCYPHIIQPFDYHKNIVYWNLTFNARSFVYRQIRRMVGALIGVAKGKITQRDIYEMLTIPSNHHFKCGSGINVAPAYGLYLAEIKFLENSLELRA